MSKVDAWIKHLTRQLGRAPTEAEFLDAVWATGKPCEEPVWERGKRRSEMAKCGKPATGWVLDALAGPNRVCVDCDPHFLGLPAPLIRPTDFEPGFYEGM